MAHALLPRLRPAPARVASRHRTRCVAGDVAPPDQGASRRAALLAATGLLFTGFGGCSAAQAGLERYVRKPKPPPALETLVANALLAQVQLQQLGAWLCPVASAQLGTYRALRTAAALDRDDGSADAKELRSGLRYGPLRKCGFPHFVSAPPCCGPSSDITCCELNAGGFREVMRSIAKVQDAADGSSLKPRVESLFRLLEGLDAQMLVLEKSEGGDARADARVRASAGLKEVNQELASILATLDSGVVDKALALL